MILLTLLLSLDAAACYCIPPGHLTYVAPAYNATDVPRNAVVRVGLHQAYTYAELYVNGFRYDRIESTIHSFAETTMLEVTPQEPFPAGATVEVRFAGTKTPVTRFVVGTDIDTEPPTWAGDYTVMSTKESSLICGDVRAHQFEWVGLEDAMWPDSEILVFAEPVGPGEPVIGTGEALHVSQSFCRDDDPDLANSMRRVYHVWFVDGAGNKAGPWRVDTRAGGPGCGGCSGSSRRASVIPLLPVWLLAWRRRRDGIPGS